MALSSILSSEGFITVSKKLIQILESVECATYFGSLCAKYDYWLNRGEARDGFFFCTQEYIEKELFLSPKKQLALCNKLESIGLVETKLKGLPRKKYYRINEKALLSILSDDKKSSMISSCAKMEQQEAPKCRNNKIKEQEKNIINILHSKRVLSDKRSFFVDELPYKEFICCYKAMEVLEDMKKYDKASNLYTGPLKLEDWQTCEGILYSSAENEQDGIEDLLRALYEERFKGKSYSRENSINLKFMVFGYANELSQNSLLHVAGMV